MKGGTTSEGHERSAKERESARGRSLHYTYGRGSGIGHRRLDTGSVGAGAARVLEPSGKGSECVERRAGTPPSRARPRSAECLLRTASRPPPPLEGARQALQHAHHPLPPSISSSRLTVPPRPPGYCPGGPPAPLRPPAACLDLAPLPLAEPAGASRWYSDGVSMIYSGE